MRTILLSSAIICGLTSHASAENCLSAHDMQAILESKAINNAIVAAIAGKGKHNVEAMITPGFYNSLIMKSKIIDKHPNRVACGYFLDNKRLLNYFSDIVGKK